MTAILWEYDTAVWYQRLETTPGGARLHRRFRNDGPWPREALSGWPAGGTASGSAWVSPVPGDGSTYNFELSVTEQLATQMWPGPAARFGADDALDLPRSVGALLAHLHGETPSGAVASNSPNVVRMREYLGTSDGPVAAALRSLQPETVMRLAAILDALDVAPRKVLCHGGFSLGSVFTDADHRASEVVIGPEVCHGPPELDLGWMLGELTEFEFAALTKGETTAFYATVAGALRESYQQESGETLDESLLAGVIAVRVALHRFDFVASTGGQEDAAVSAFVDWLVARWATDRGEETVR